MLFAVFILSMVRGYGQYYTNQNKIWVFGEWAGIDFTLHITLYLMAGNHAVANVSSSS